MMFVCVFIWNVRHYLCSVGFFALLEIIDDLEEDVYIYIRCFLYCYIMLFVLNMFIELILYKNNIYYCCY